MGIDFLDLTFQLEKKHHLRFNSKAARLLPSEVVATRERVCFIPIKSWDIHVGPFFDYIRKHCDPVCQSCKSVVKKLPDNTCPTCHAPVAPDLTWEQFQESLGKVTATPPSEIQTTTWLKRDLGFC